MKKIYLLATLALFSLLPELQANTDWTGNAGTTDWTNPGNWTSGVPDLNDDVEIPTGLSYYPVIISGVTALVKKITIKGTLTMNGGTLNHNKEFKVDVGGSFVQNDGIVHGAADIFDPPAQSFKNNGTVIQTGGTINCKDFKIEKATAIFNQSGTTSLVTIVHDYKTKNDGTFNSTGGTVKWTGEKEGGPDVVFDDGTNQFFNVQFAGTKNPNIQKKGGTLLIRGNWVNNNTSLDLISDKTVNVIFNGSNPQNIGGAFSTTFDNLEINTSGGAKVTLTGDQAVDTDLSILAGTLEVTSVSTLTVSGTLTNNVGSTGLVLKSDATGTGSLIESSGVNATVERYLTDLQWHFIGSPVESEVAGVFHLPGGHSNIYLRTHIEATNTWGPYIVPVNTPLIQCRGYECWVADNVNQDEKVEFDGVLNTGDYTTGTGSFYTLEYTSGHGLNLICNPYASALEADIDTWTKSNIDNSVWVWSGAPGSGNYLTWNGSTGSLTGGIIPSMQAFFVFANNASPSLTIPQSDRTHNSQAYYKDSGMPNTIRLDVEGNGYNDAIFVSFNESATDEYDGEYDVIKIYGLDEAPQLYSIIPGEILSINSLSELDEYRVVNLGFECGVPEIFTIEASEIESFEENTTIYLEDLKEGVMHNLSENPSYAFAHEIGDDPNRFLLHFGEPSSIDENNQQNVRIYSNEGVVYIHQAAGIKGEITIYDMIGGEILSQKIGDETLSQIKITEGTGYYLVTLQTEKFVVVEKVFIK